MDLKKCCELLQPLYGENNDYGLFREDLTDAEKSNLKKNLKGGACFHWKGVIPGNGYDFYKTNEQAFHNLLLNEKNNTPVLKIWDEEKYGEQLTEDRKKQLLLTKDQKQRIVDYCKHLYETGTPESTYVADCIMNTGLKHPIYKKYFEEDNLKIDIMDTFPKLNYQKENDNTNWLGWGAGGTAAGAGLGKLTGRVSLGKGALIGAAVSLIGKGTYNYFQKKLKNATYTEKNGPALLQQVQDELDGKTLQKQQESMNTQSREKEQEIAKINEERQKEQEEQQQKEEERQKNEERRKEEHHKKEEEREKDKERKKEKASTQIKETDSSQKNTNQPATVRVKKGQVITQPTNVQNLNDDLNAIRQKITEETQNSTNAPAIVDASQLDNNKSLQAAIAVKEQGSWWSRNWDILALIGGALGALGLGFWLVKRQKNKTKKAQAEASTLANQVSSLNSKVSSLTEALNTQSNQPATNTGTNTDTNTGTNTGTGNGSTLENSGSSVPNDSSTDSSSVDKGRPVKIVIKGKTSSEME